MFGERLKIIRKQAGLSQKSLASLLQVSQQSVWKWEMNESSPNPETVAKIAKIFHVSSDYLLGLTEQEEKPTPENGGGLNKEQQELVSLFESASPALRSAALAVLKSAEGQDKAPGGASQSGLICCPASVNAGVHHRICDTVTLPLGQSVKGEHKP